MKHPGFYASPEMDFDDFLREPFPRLLVISVTLALAGLTFWAFATYLQDGLLPLRDENGKAVGFSMLGQLSFAVLCLGTPLLHCIAFGWAGLVTRKQPVGFCCGFPACLGVLALTWASAFLLPLQPLQQPLEGHHLTPISFSLCDHASWDLPGPLHWRDGALTRRGKPLEPIKLQLDNCGGRAHAAGCHLFLRPVLRCDGAGCVEDEICAWAVDMQPPTLLSDCSGACGSVVTLDDVTSCGAECAKVETAMKPHMVLAAKTLGLPYPTHAPLIRLYTPSTELAAESKVFAYGQRMYWTSAVMLTFPAVIVVITVAGALAFEVDGVMPVKSL